MFDDERCGRSHYYVYAKPYSANAVPVNVSGTVAYIHKEHRGFGRHHFTHNDFVSLVRVLGFKFFNFKCLNVERLIANAESVDMTYTPDAYCCEPADSTAFVQGDRYYAQITRSTRDTFFEHANDKTSRRNWIFGRPALEFCNDGRFDYDACVFRLTDFCRFVDDTMKTNALCRLLVNPVTYVYRELEIKLELYRFHRDVDVFKYDAFPSLYDYINALDIFRYIKNLHTLDETCSQPCATKV